MTRARSLAHRAGHRLSRSEHVVEAIVVILSTMALLVGLSMLWVPQAYDVPSFRLAMDALPPHVWGGALLTLSVSTFVALRGDRITRAAVLVGQQFTLAGLAVFLIIATAKGEGIPSTAVMFGGLSLFCFILAGYYWQTRDAVPHAA